MFPGSPPCQQQCVSPVHFDRFSFPILRTQQGRNDPQKGVFTAVQWAAFSGHLTCHWGRGIPKNN